MLRLPNGKALKTFRRVAKDMEIMFIEFQSKYSINHFEFLPCIWTEQNSVGGLFSWFTVNVEIIQQKHCKMIDFSLNRLFLFIFSREERRRESERKTEEEIIKSH